MNLTEQVLKKSFKELRIEKPYRKPTQVDKRKYAKVNGWDLVKELGKSVAVSSQYGLPLIERLRAATNVLQATVYQKHSSVLTRKRMYTGWSLTSAGMLSLGVVSARVLLTEWSTSERRR